MTLVLIAAVAVFLLGNLYRAVRVMRMPVHLRWDLYPIPKGPRDRQRYGGSYFEETEWWTKSMATGRRGGLAVMLKEVLFLRGVYENFRGLWIWSLLLHWGFYLYFISAAITVCARLVPGPIRPPVLNCAFAGCSVACACGVLGSVGLMWTRTVSRRLRGYTSRATAFNLCMFAAMFGSGLITLRARNRGLIEGFLQIADWRHVPQTYSTVGYCHFALLAFFLAYFPFTHMTHMYMKYFTWHRVRWDDTPSRFDQATQNAIAANLGRRVSWRAPHVGTTGQSWAEVASNHEQRGNDQHA
jgi:nitrate reductase gamma subunit